MVSSLQNTPLWPFSESIEQQRFLTFTTWSLRNTQLTMLISDKFRKINITRGVLAMQYTNWTPREQLSEAQYVKLN